MDPEKISELLPAQWGWLIEIAIGLGIVIVLSFVLRKIAAYYKKRKDKRQGWHAKIDKVVHMPLQIAIWGVGFSFVIDVLGTRFGFEETVSSYIRPLEPAFIVGCIGWVGLRWLKQAFNHLEKKSKKLGVNPGTIYALNKLVSFVYVIIVLMVIFGVLGINIAPLLAFGGIGVAGIAFAAQDMIANFFGGAMLHFTRNFHVGDEVVIPSQSDFEGEVREIGWYVTVIEDYYRRPVYFPNALFTKAHVINESRRSHRRIKETISIRYEDAPKLEPIIEELRIKVGEHPAIDETQSYSIAFSKFGDSGLEIYFYLLIHQMGYTKFLQAKQEVFLIVKEVVEKHGAEFSYPTQVLHFAPDTKLT